MLRSFSKTSLDVSFRQNDFNLLDYILRLNKKLLFLSKHFNFFLPKKQHKTYTEFSNIKNYLKHCLFNLQCIILFAYSCVYVYLCTCIDFICGIPFSFVFFHFMYNLYVFCQCSSQNIIRVFYHFFSSEISKVKRLG